MASSHNLIFLHGWGTSPRVWENQIEHFSKKYSVNAIDLFDHKSENLSSVLCPLYSVLIGWSYGGMRAIQMAVREPDKYKALVLVGSSARFSDGISPVVIKNILRNLKRDFEATMRNCCGTFFSNEEDGFRKKFINEQVLPDKDSTIQILQELLTLDLKENLKYIDIPTLLIHGGKDNVCPAGAGRFLNENIKNSKLIVLKGAGHMPFYTRPKEFNAILKEFVKDVD